MSRRMPLVISHYTKGTGYEEESKNLIASLQGLKLASVVDGMEHLGSWRANSNYCAKQVQQMLHTFPDFDVLRVDADARFRQRPVIFEQDDFDADIAAVVHDFPWRKNELLGGTLFFRNNKMVKDLVSVWVEKACNSSRKNERNGDLLQEILGYGPYQYLKFVKLPPTYCQIFDLMANCGDPVIEHFQASRRFKRQVNQIGVV